MFISLLSMFFFTKTSLGSIVCSERLLAGLCDDKLTASSMFRSQDQPAYARLDSTDGDNWCSSLDDKTPYIQVKMNARTVGGVITQGIHSLRYWVKSYHVRYRDEHSNWTYIKEPGGSIKLFNGNSDQNTWVTNKFNPVIRVQILRIYPIKCRAWCCLRFDVLGCEDGVTATAMTESVNEPNKCFDEIQATPIRSATGITTSAMAKSVQELTTFTEEIQATPTRLAAGVITTTAMTELIQGLTTFTEEIKATPTRHATGVITTTALMESVQELFTFTEEIQATPTRRAAGVITTTAMTELIQGLTTFTEEIKATPTRHATGVITTTALMESVQKLFTFTEEIQATPIRRATGVITTTALMESVQELFTFTEEIQATPTRRAAGVITTTAMTELIQGLTTFTEEIKATPTRHATGVITTTALMESVQKLFTFTEEIQATPIRRAPFVTTTMKVLQESTESEYMSSTKKELSTLIDVLPPASSTSFAQSMASMSPTNCGETLNNGNATTEPRCYMACSQNHTKQELVEMVDKLKQELRTDTKKTSMYIRSKTSASDERKSSAAIGCVGVVILCAVGIGILLLDLPHLVDCLKHVKVNKKVTPAVRA